MAEQPPLRELLALIRKEADENVLAQAGKRQQAVWEGSEPDYLPLLLSAPNPEREQYPRYDLEEQFYDPEKMLYEQLWSALGVVRGRSDGVPSIRVSFGTGFLASVFGLNQEVFPDKMPWLKEHLSGDEIRGLTPAKLEPLEERGLLPEFRRYIGVYRGYLKSTPVHIYLPDTQGAFDIAHLVYGDALFTELYDDPDFVKHLLGLTSSVYRRASILMKEWIGEPLDSGHHSGNLCLSCCGVRSCEDSTTLISPHLAAMVMPFSRESVAPFGGWFHFCGDGRTLLEPLLSAPEVRGLNFGNPEKYDWDVTLRKIAAAGKVYYGGIPRREREPLAGYLERIVSLLERKSSLILTLGLPDGEDRQETFSLWHRLQDRILKP